MKKKTTILTLIVCASMLHTNQAAEGKRPPQETPKTITAEPTALTTDFVNPEETRPVYKVTSSAPLWLTQIQDRIEKNEKVDAKDRDFIEHMHSMVVIGNVGGIIYYFADKPTQRDIQQLTRQFPYANMLFIAYKHKDSYCVDFQPAIANTPVQHEMTIENIDAFLKKIATHRASKK